MKLGGIILAAGKGVRFQGKKQFIELNGKALWLHVYDKLLQVVKKENIIVVGVDIEGGETRSESVKKGLNELNNSIDRVIILEAARPLVTVHQIEILLNDKNKSSTFVMPLVNTVIYKDGRYINREDLYELLTPQAFDFKLLKAAYNSGKYHNKTDETRVMFEEYGIKPNFIETGENLLKVTYKKDIPIIETLYQKGLEENEKGFDYGR